MFRDNHTHLVDESVDGATEFVGIWSPSHMWGFGVWVCLEQ